MPADHEGSTSQKQLGNWLPPVNHDNWESHEQPTNWPQLLEHPGFMSQGQNGNWLPPVDHDDWESQEQPVNWPQLPEHPDFAPQGQPLGWAPSAGHMGLNPRRERATPSSGSQPSIMRGCSHKIPASRAPSADHAFQFPKTAPPLDETDQSCRDVRTDISPLCCRRPPILLVLAPVGSRRTGAVLETLQAGGDR